LSSIPRPPSSTLFPYTTLSDLARRGGPRCPRDGGAHLPPARPARGAARAGLPHLVPDDDAEDRDQAGRQPRRRAHARGARRARRSEEHTSELQSLAYLVCRLLL